ncbi:uncharacterized protein LOC117228918 isoform X3 [Megalopta genalis]|uniref:uncharacterized protein LOC117228918 isoform X3 n=1 Tax=Megalopta genalis TaxID=115081 RepID=UPI003FD226C1
MKMFYIQAPRGQISLHILEKCVFVRLEYLDLLYQARTNEFNGNFEYLLENSVYDKVGHFTLRLLASISQDLWNYWIVREALLFQNRLIYILPKQLHRLIRSIIRQCRLLTNKESVINNTLIDICIFFSKELVFKHLVTKDHKQDCSRFHTKDGGMHIEDAINYWKDEYSKPHSCSSTCSHQWQSNERKFIYSIRHLYGLEGSRKNYKSVDCEFLCAAVSGPTYEGGCPFKNFDINVLKDLLSLSLSGNQITELLNIISPQAPRCACTSFFKIVGQINNSNIFINSPLQYYLAMVNKI